MNSVTIVKPSDRTERIKRRMVRRHKRQRQPAIISNDQIKSIAQQRLQSCHNFELRRVQCDVEHGSLIIYGRVSSYYLKQLAQEFLRSLAGEYRIVNHLEVVYVSATRYEP